MRIFQGLSMTAAAAVLLIAGAARADELTSLPGQRDQGDSGPVVGVGVICNTSTQAEQFVSLRQEGQDITPAVAKVNQQAQDPRACGVAAVAFMPDKIMATKPMGGKLVKIVRINVVAGYNGSGWHRVASTVQYAILPAQGEDI